MASEEPPAKKAKTWPERLAEHRDEAKEKHGREEMLDAIFTTWDRDGNGEIEFEEVLPHYMKAANHQDLIEQDVRNGFDKFMTSQGKTGQHGLTPELFRKWLAKLSDDGVATQYVRSVMGVTEHPYAMNINKAVDKDFEGKSFKEILDARISAIQGLTEMHEVAFASLGLKTVRDLGTWRFFIMARAIVDLASKEDDKTVESKMNIRSALDQQHESKTLRQILELPPSAFNMFPDEADRALGMMSPPVKTIQSLGSRKTFIWANAMAELEKHEFGIAA